MLVNAMEMEAPIRQAVEKYIRTCSYDNASFLAERLISIHRSEPNLYLLAKCYHHKQQWNRVISLLSGSKSMENQYLLALCYYETKQLLRAKETLLQNLNLPACHSAHDDMWQTELRAEPSRIPNGPAGLYLLGCINKKDHCLDHAMVCFEVCLEKDPFFWKAYEELCDMGTTLQPQQFFGASTCFTVPHLNEISMTESTTPKAPFGTSCNSMDGEMNTPIFSGTRSKSRTKRSSAKADPAFSNPRRSGRLSFSSVADSPSFILKDPISPIYSPDENLNGKQMVAALLCTFGMAYQQLSQYQGDEALEMLNALPVEQVQSGWVQQHIGRAYFEMSQYAKAQKVFEQLRILAPYRMEGLATYSTILWHLQKDVEICFLAQEIADYEKTSCEVWCVIGNCFSRQKEHEAALKFFKRALQIDPYFTYAHTLCGHEYVANEDFDQAVSCYRQAVRIDPRHYTAWYGLGTIYYRQEKFQLAEYHFRRALLINPRSSLLYCYLGMVLLSNDKCEEALDMLEKATALRPENPQARFQRANVLIAQNRLELALEELQAVRDHAPREASVHFLMGKTCKKMGQIDEAMKHYMDALYFNPKDNNMIKLAIDRLNDPEEEDDDHI